MGFFMDLFAERHGVFKCMIIIAITVKALIEARSRILARPVIQAGVQANCTNRSKTSNRQVSNTSRGLR